jgi:hypothetical protein
MVEETEAQTARRARRNAAQQQRRQRKKKREEDSIRGEEEVDVWDYNQPKPQSAAFKQMKTLVSDVCVAPDDPDDGRGEEQQQQQDPQQQPQGQPQQQQPPQPPQGQPQQQQQPQAQEQQEQDVQSPARGLRGSESALSRDVERLLVRLRDPHDQLVALGDVARWPRRLRAHWASVPASMHRADLHALVPAALGSPRLRLLVLTGTCTASSNHDTLMELVLEHLPASRVVCLNLGELESPLAAQLPDLLQSTGVGHVFVDKLYHTDLKHQLVAVCRRNRAGLQYKRDVVEPVAWQLATSGGAHCFWNLTERNESFARRRRRYLRALLSPPVPDLDQIQISTTAEEESSSCVGRRIPEKRL